MAASIKQAVLRAIARGGYVVLKSSDNCRMLTEHYRLAAELAEARQRAQQLDTQQAEARQRAEQTLQAERERMVSTLIDARKGHEYALRELEQSRADEYELRNRLKQVSREIAQKKDEMAQVMAEMTQVKDENRRLTIRVTEIPEIDHQVLMRQQHEAANFRDADPVFMALYERVKAFSMTSLERLYAMHKAAEYVSKAAIRGSIVECGVWRGGSMMMAALTLAALADTDRKLVLFDTFAGLPKPNQTEDVDLCGHACYDEWARHRRTNTSSDWAYASLEQVRDNMTSTGYPMENVVFVKGMVQDTLPRNLPDAVSLLRLDTDGYESTVSELTHLYPLLSHNGVLIVDDYGNMRGQRKAVDEYLAGRTETVLLNRIDYSGRLAIKSSGVQAPHE